jgi:ribosomal protein L37AE/L43A
MGIGQGNQGGAQALSFAEPTGIMRCPKCNSREIGRLSLGILQCDDCGFAFADEEATIGVEPVFD